MVDFGTWPLNSKASGPSSQTPKEPRLKEGGVGSLGPKTPIVLKSVEDLQDSQKQQKRQAPCPARPPVRPLGRMRPLRGGAVLGVPATVS